MTADDTGVGLLVFARPDHTRRVLDGLANNDIDHLYVFADAPQTEDDIRPVEATREVVRSADFCDIELITREVNLGLKESFIDAYDHLFERHRKAIVFEDDCVPSGDCIRYFRACLDKYETNERVMNVHGYGPPIKIPETYPYDVYFTYRVGSWGQATWRDKWEHFERDPKLLDRIQSDPELRRKVQRAGPDMIPMLRQEISGKIDSVQIWWGLSLVRNDGVSINPIESKVKNIGVDGTGVHSGTSTYFDVDIDEEAEFSGLSFPPTTDVNPTLNERYNRFISQGFRGRVRRWVRVRLPHLINRLS